MSELRSSVSAALYERAQKVLPGGVNSPVRAYQAVGRVPRFISRGYGSRVTDADGNSYIDYIGSYGPLIHGHAPEGVINALRTASSEGLTFGAPTAREVELADAVARLVPSVEVVRFVNSGTEAVMSAVRLARGVTGRPLLLKFDGGYHGHSDGLLVAAGSGPATLGVPDSAGVIPAIANSTISVPYNDLGAVERAFELHATQLAAVIVEPVAGNMGVVPPQEGFLPGLRELCDSYGTLLVFDEVITGFRVALGGAQELYGVTPDISCFGKILGGGLPVGAYGGPAELMRNVAPVGDVYQAGTLSGNPLVMAAGLATLEALASNPPYDELDRLGAALSDGLAAAAAEAGLPHTTTRVGSMLSMFFTNAPVWNYADAKRSDTKCFARYFHGMLEHGVMLAPSQFEAMFVSVAHKQHDIHETVEAAHAVMASIADKGGV